MRPMLDDSACYKALLAKDPRFDGLFFVGVATTGVYCRPICPARKPRASSCSYFASAAAAEAAGFRPCLRCRPELAPCVPAYEQGSDLASGIVARIQAGDLSDGYGVADLADSFGLSARHLRRLVKEATGVTPVALAQTSRLLLAKQLLTETDRSIIDVAFDSGFSSLRRFNELFAERCGICPRDFRRRPKANLQPSEVELRLAYRPPFAWRQHLDFLSARAIPGVESVQGDSYQRTVSLGGTSGWIRVEPARQRSEVRVCVAASLTPHLQSVLARLRQLFDLNATPHLVDAHLGEDRHLGAVLAALPGLRVPGAFDGFELAWRAVLGQQVSVAAATTLAGRLAERFGIPLQAPRGKLTFLSPSSAVLARKTPDAIASIGLPLNRARSIVAMAGLDQERPRLLSPGFPPDEARLHLSKLPGIGHWTVEYILMRALHWPDAFPSTDLGLRKAAARLGLADLCAACRKWRPWRAYAAMHLWMLNGDRNR